MTAPAPAPRPVSEEILLRLARIEIKLDLLLQRMQGEAPKQRYYVGQGQPVETSSPTEGTTHGTKATGRGRKRAARRR
jgi:hypothetical protein